MTVFSSYGNDIIGWIMAYLPNGSDKYSFELFEESINYHCDLLLEGKFETLNAQQRAEKELMLLKEGKLKKFGQKVETGYIMPVVGRLKP